MTESDSKRSGDWGVADGEDETIPGDALSPEESLLLQTGYQAGERLGRYEIIGKLGAGAMGVVFEAHDPKLDRRLAIKVLLRGESARAVDPSTGELRLLREARALARLSHPNVVPIYDVGLTDEGDKLTRVYIAMELIQGETLRQWLAPRRGWRTVLTKLAAAGHGLAAAHSAGLVHRDFKPDNVLIDPTGRVRVMDFGLARGAGADEVPSSGDVSASVSLDETMTRTGSIVGTPAYMAPEQHLGRRVDERADQYSFCLVAFEALYGKRPFSAPDVHALARTKLSRNILEVDALGVPDHVHQAIIRGLAPDPEERWPSMQALLRALKIAVRQRRRWPVAMVALVAGGGAYALWSSQQPGSASVCMSGSAAWETTWGTTAASETRAAFAATGVPSARRQFERVRSELDRYGQGWVEAYDNTCAALQAPEDPSDLDRKMLCLDLRREQVDSVLEVLRSSSLEGLVRGPELVASLRPVADCDNPFALDIDQPTDGRQRHMVDQARRSIDLAASRTRAGDPTQALADATAAYVLAHTTQFEPAQAVAAEQLAVVYSDLALDEYAEALYEESVLVARSSGLDDQAVSAIAHLVFVVGHRQQRLEEGLEWARMGRALLERGDVPVHLHVHLLQNEALVYSEHGQSDAALELLETALELRHSHLPENQVGLAMLYNNLGTTLNELGRLDEAMDFHERAREIRERTLGKDHPEYAMSLSNLASSLFRQGEYKEAIRNAREAMKTWDAVYGRQHHHAATTLNVIATSHVYLGEPEAAIDALRSVLKLRRKTRPPGHSSVVSAYGNLGGAYMQAERWDEAEQAFQEALALHSATRVADPAQTAWLHYNLGVIDFEQGRYDEAEATLTHSLEEWKHNRDEDHYSLSFPLSMLGRIELHRRDFSKAAEILERSHRLASSAPGNPRTVYTTFLLARALWEGGEDESRAWSLATQARDALHTAPPPYDTERAEIAAWLEARADRARRLGLPPPLPVVRSAQQ